MDQQFYWSVAEADIEIQNPITDRKLRQLDDYCDIGDGVRVLDLGCGKAWLLRQWAEKHAIEGVGIDVNPRFLEVARQRAPARGHLEFFEMPARDFAAEPNSFDVVMCLGATFALDGFVSAVERMARFAKPGGAVVVGDLTLRQAPEVKRDERLPNDPVDTAGVVDRHGCDVSAMISSSVADFERYVSHHRHATLRWARDNPNHPDRQAVLDKSRADWNHYLRIVRPYVGWTIYVGQKR